MYEQVHRADLPLLPVAVARDGEHLRAVCERKRKPEIVRRFDSYIPFPFFLSPLSLLARLEYSTSSHHHSHPYHNIHRRFEKIRINKNVPKNIANIIKIMKHDVKELLQLRFSCSSDFFSSTCRPFRFRCAASSVLSSTCKI